MLSLQLKSFNDALCSIVGSTSLPITVRTKIVQIVLQVIEGNITQYNILLGIPCIKDMKCILSTYHKYLKFIHEGVLHYILGNENIYSYCNSTHLPNDITFPSTHFCTIPIPKSEVLVNDSYTNGSISNVSK